jgi:Ca2+-binding EF-hand superfamily protein
MNTLVKVTAGIVTLGVLTVLAPNVDAEYKLTLNNVDYSADSEAQVNFRPRQARMQMPKFSDFDTNEDGLISPDELARGRAERIQKKVAEGKRMRNLKNAPRFEDIDIDESGFIDPDEFSRYQIKFH